MFITANEILFIIAYHRHTIITNKNNLDRCIVHKARSSDKALTWTIQITLPLIPVFWNKQKALGFML